MNETKLIDSNFDIINNVTNIYTVSMFINFIETFIDQTSKTHLHIFLIIVAVLILLISIFIFVLCNKIIFNKTPYRSAVMEVIT